MIQRLRIYYEGGWLFAAWVQFKANGRRSPIDFFKGKNSLINEYETTRRLPEVWDEEK